MSKITNSDAPRRVRNRSVPAPLTFDPSVLPENAVLTTAELGACPRRG
jgi:hypothetical protein